MKDKNKTKEQLIEELVELRQKINDLEITKIKQESKQYALRDSEKSMIESESRYRMIFENANDGIIIHDTEGRIFDVNQNMYKKLGYTKEEMLNISLRDLVSPEYAKKIKGRTKKLEEEGVAIFESEDMRKNGTAMSVEVSARHIEYKGQKVILSIVRDITERKMAEDLIMAAIKEKEALLKEVQHRAKNNMQSISNMLRIQSMEIKDKKIRTIFEENQRRIKSMSFIHEKMYRFNNYSRIDFADFVNSLTKNLFTMYGVSILNIRLVQEAEDIYLDIHRAIPCGMIVNELVSNSLKHAFPKGERGVIVVRLTEDKKGKYQLTIIDNGIGFPETLDYRKTKTLGLQLVNDFVKQINGAISLSRLGGTTFQITF